MPIAPRNSRVRNIGIAVAAAVLLACLVFDDVRVCKATARRYGVIVATRFGVTSYLWYNIGTTSVQWIVADDAHARLFFVATDRHVWGPVPGETRLW